MSIRIRVYPQNGAYGGLGGLGGYGVANTRVRLTQQQLQNERKTANMQLQYERALWAEKLKFVQLQAQMQNPYAALSMGGLGGFGALGGAFGLMSPLGVNALGVQSNGFFNSLGLGGLF